MVIQDAALSTNLLSLPATMSHSKMDTINMAAAEHAEKLADEKGSHERLGFDPTLEAGGSHHKSPAERRLVLKADSLILPLISLVFLIAYMVRFFSFDI